MSRIQLFIITIVIVIIAFGIWIFKQITPSLPTTLTLYTSITCPHCQAVDQFIKKNNLHRKLDFTEKQLESHKTYIHELMRVVRFCGYHTNQLPIPVLWTGSEKSCIIGERDIIHYFNQKISPRKNQSTVTKITPPQRHITKK